MKHYARIEIAKDVYAAREKSVELVTIFGNVFAPKSKIIVESESNNTITILVPCWVFWNNDLNPCHMVKGFIEQIKY